MTRGPLLVVRLLVIAALALTYPSPIEVQENTLPHQVGAAETRWVELVGDNGAVGISNIQKGMMQ